MKTYKDFYKPPYSISKYGSHIWDSKDHMVAQFEYKFTKQGNFDPEFKKLTENILEVLSSDDKKLESNHTFRKEGLHIFIDNYFQPIITIRGWGRLTGIGGYNLSDEDAINVQDTFADWIVNRLNNEQKS